MTIKPHPTDQDKVIYFNPIESIEVMRITRDGVTVSSGVSVDEAAKVVLAMLDANIKLLVSKAVEEEREGCINSAGYALLGAEKALADRVLKAIKARSEK